MGKVMMGLSVSLDGFIAGPNGEDGGLHDWVFRGTYPVTAGGMTFKLASENSAAFFGAFSENTGAVVIGKRAFNTANDNPIFELPTFVLTHEARETVNKDGVPVVFVSDGIESALKQAKAAAGEKDVCIFGGAETVRQYLEAGLLDELQLDIVGVLLGEGLRLFDWVGAKEIRLEQVRVIESVNVTHLVYRVVKKDALTDG